MKYSILLAALFAAKIAYAQSHPLDAVVKSLAKTADDIQQVSKQNGYVKEMDGELELYKNQVSAMTFQALQLPVKAADQRMSRAGYDIKWTNELHIQYEVEENARAQQLAKEALELKLQSFEGLLTETEAQKNLVRSIGRMGTNSEYVRNLNDKQRSELVNMFNATRSRIIGEIEAYAQRALDCIRYFNQIVPESGLNAVAGTSGEYQWSIADIQDKYGVVKLSSLNRSQKRTVAGQLEGMLRTARESGYVCIAAKKARFYRDELAGLKNEVGQ